MLTLPAEALTGEELEHLTQNLPAFQALPACPGEGQLGASDSVNKITNSTVFMRQGLCGTGWHGTCCVDQAGLCLLSE